MTKTTLSRKFLKSYSFPRYMEQKLLNNRHFKMIFENKYLFVHANQYTTYTPYLNRFYKY